MSTLTPEQRAEVVEAMARAYAYWEVQTADSKDEIREYCMLVLDAALPLIERAMLAREGRRVT